MPKRFIYIFNPEADYALAEYKESYTPPAAVVKLRKNLALDQLRYARPEDFLLLLDNPSDFTEVSDDRLIIPEKAKSFFRKIAHEAEDFEIRPWNWTPDLVGRMRRWGCPEVLLPTKEHLDLIRRLSDRATTIDFNRELNRNLEKKGLGLHASPLPMVFEDEDKAIEWKKSSDKVFFKYPWSSSGRGVLSADESISDQKLRQWLSGGIRRQGHIMGELFFEDKNLDFATEWEMRDGKANFLGISLFYASADGHYLNNDIRPQREIRKKIMESAKDFSFDFILTQKEALEKIAGDYSGFVGIDMMADGEGRIRGGVELNFRLTMGIAALLEESRGISADSAHPATKILILGNGNVGSHLANAFFLSGIDVELHSSRSQDYSLDGISHVIIAVKDDAIPEVASAVSAKIKNLRDGKAPIVVHTSGSISISCLEEILPEGVPYGVFYPMQTFTRGVSMNYSSIPFLLEASNSETFRNLREIALLISETAIEADSSVRASYHIGAVLTCNFANHLCSLASDFLSSKGLDFKILMPLLEQTIAKLMTSTPQESQTGPASRGDLTVVDYHLDKLEMYPHIREIYSLLSNSIHEYSKSKK
ncbi:MAG: DUF2520 domain-containing protein [Muribaculaceae bacterium]|nr:DUF2520 domain-containing protein [Muribaculaceae bacterium]